MEKLRSEIKDEYKWDLTRIIKDDNDFETKLQQLDKLFNKVLSYKGKIMSSSETLYNFYIDYIEYLKLEGDLIVYTGLLVDEDTGNNDSKILNLKLEKILEEYNTSLSFISPEMLEVDYETVLKYIDDNDKLKEFAFDLEKTYRFQDHVLSENEEELISEASKALGVGSNAFTALNNTDIDLGEIEDENNKSIKLTNSNYIKFIMSNNRNVRKNAFKSLYAFWDKHKNTVAETYKGQVKEDFFYSKIRNFNSPLEASLYSDNISVKMYKKLIEIVHNNLELMYKYISIRKKALNLDEIHLYDMSVDLVNTSEKEISFDNGKKIIIDALKPLGERYVNDLKTLLSENRIDVYPNKGKKSGAYKWGSYNSGPFVLLNYENNRDGVEALIHELGHAMHSYYSNEKQSYVYSQYPIFLAEIASTVNEILLNDYMIKNASSKEEKKLYICDFLDKVRLTLFRQTMFAEFESLIHDKENKGIPLTEQEMSDTYYELNKLYFGEYVIVDEEIRHEWMRIPHFYTPFYVYKYATGISAAISIASDILNEKEGALENYLEFLTSGCSDYPLNVLKKVGIDMESGKPIENALKMFEKRVIELEELL